MAGDRMVNGLIYYREGTGHYGAKCLYTLEEKREFFEDCIKDAEDIEQFVWADKSRTHSELIEIMEKLG